MQSLAVFCGSYKGNLSAYNSGILELAETLTTQNITLVYGGSNVGIMGVLANAVLTNKGNVIGVIPQSLVDVEIAHKQLTDLKIVNSMHERKALIEKLSDGFILLPGGIGSLDEFYEIFTWAKIGIHTKPIGILNLNGYYDQLIKFMESMVAEKFLEKHHWDYVLIDNDAKSLINRMQNRKFNKNEFKVQYEIS